MKNILDKSCRENRNIHFIFSNTLPENRAVYEIISKNVVETKAAGNIAHARCVLDKEGYTRASTLPHLCNHTHTHACTKKQALN